MSTPLFTAIVIALSVTMFTHASTRHRIVEPFTVGFPFAIQANNVNRDTGSISNTAQFDENATRAPINPEQITRQRRVGHVTSSDGVPSRDNFALPSLQNASHASNMRRLADITAPRRHQRHHPGHHLGRQQGVRPHETFGFPSLSKNGKIATSDLRFGDIFKSAQAHNVEENYGSSMGLSPRYSTMNSRGYAPIPSPPSRRPSRPSYNKYPSNANPPRLTVAPSYDKTVPQYRFATPTHAFGPMRPKNVEQTFGVDPLNPMNLSYSGHKMASPQYVAPNKMAPIPSTEGYLFDREEAEKVARKMQRERELTRTKQPLPVQEGYMREGYEQEDDQEQQQEGQLTNYDNLMNQITNSNHTRCGTPAQEKIQDPVHINVTEYVYAPQKSRLQAYADYFRGDLDVTPVNSSPLAHLDDSDPTANYMFRPAANAQMLRQGVLNVIAGRNEASDRGAKLHAAFTGGANSTYGGTTRHLSGREVPGDITVKSFV